MYITLPYIRIREGWLPAYDYRNLFRWCRQCGCISSAGEAFPAALRSYMCCRDWPCMLLHQSGDTSGAERINSSGPGYRSSLLERKNDCDGTVLFLEFSVKIKFGCQCSLPGFGFKYRTAGCG